MAFAVIGLWPFLKALKVRTLAEAGLHSKQWGKNLLLGFLCGAGALVLFGAVSVLLGGREFVQHSPAEWVRHFINATLAAVAAGFLEELVFRGGLFGGLRQSYSFCFAAGLSSFIYALVHFLSRPGSPAETHWYSGLLILGQMFDGFSRFQNFVPGFFNLFLLGMILSLAFERTGAILFGVGLHAAVIFMSKTVRFATDVILGANSWFWGTNKVIDGWFAFLVLLLLYVFVRAVVKTRAPV
jgi:membrane protease YdiL (CAAX protease family)